MEREPARRAESLARVIRVFRDSVLVDPPHVMPLTREVAPKFAALFPAAANIFDNLHMMHDVVNDIMVDERVEDKAFEIEKIRRLMIYKNQDFVIPPPLPAIHGEQMAGAHAPGRAHPAEGGVPRAEGPDQTAASPAELCRGMSMRELGDGR